MGRIGGTEDPSSVSDCGILGEQLASASASSL